MFCITIPGHEKFEFHHLVLDYNGTIAHDGHLIAGVAERLELLSHQMTIDVITADTHGSADEQLSELPIEVTVIPYHNQDQAKFDHVVEEGADGIVAIGNGYNDHLMLKEVALGIAVMQKEGIAINTLQSADILVPDILAALDLLLKPKRLIATLRN